MKNALFQLLAMVAGVALPGAVMGQTESPAAAMSAETELARIRSSRVKIEDAFASGERLCYQKFAVNDCVGRARITRREAVADLRRQELAINAAEARRRGADQISKTEEKLSPQAMRETEQRLLEAQASQQERLKSIDERAAERERVAKEAPDRARALKERVDANAAVQAERAAKTETRTASQQEFELKQQAARKRQEDQKKRLIERKNAPVKLPAAPASGVPANASGR